MLVSKHGSSSPSLPTIFDPRAPTHPKRVITQYDLPATIIRWGAAHKALIIEAVKGGLITEEEALARYAIGEAEFRRWQELFKEGGVRELEVEETYSRRDSTGKKRKRLPKDTNDTKEVLKLLRQRVGVVVTTEEVLDYLYGDFVTPESGRLKVLFWYIRTQLRKEGNKERLVTVWGRGYMLEKKPPE